ncbi:hypothetical protein H2200_011617 [Cladophialophora chaetospira]|uniref:Calcineurin-like phosphoesterase domain-containing protein n=1 Tax=Cladophialophora chaetospira TaxID=386627 RepID=A0AA38WZN4_9EURO|nr:hypothetical protein H2200_011617 [Cladophialophora chaetospira]
MYTYVIVGRLLRLLLPVALCLTAYLYFYPLFHGCVFPAADGSTVTAWNSTLRRHFGLLTGADVEFEPSLAPFRLLALADPQLEGDSSLPKPQDAFLPKLGRHWARLSKTPTHEIVPSAVDVGRQIVLQDFPEAAKALRKRIDLFGNDYYLGHIYRTLHWWTKPSHVTVLGDLIGSQWVTDEEFDWRGWRYWNRVFADGRSVQDSITHLEDEEEEKVFAMDDATWTNRIINIAGNHDIGYAGDISRSRMERFERVFGTANWDVRFHYPQSNQTARHDKANTQPSLHLIVLNSLVLDTPVLSEDLRSETCGYLKGLISQRLRPVEDRSSFTLLLTHLPLHKKEGTCVDAPFFDYWPNDDGGGVYRPHGLREQNHLSEHTSYKGTLQALFGMSGKLDAPAQGKGRNGLILTGHDHEGCDTWHFIPSESVWSPSDDEGEEKKQTVWDVSKWQEANHNTAHTGVREVTLRSMMGDYGGNAGLLSAWFDFEDGEWKHDIQMCGLNLKTWWAVHIVDLIVLVLSLFNTFSFLLPTRSGTVKQPAAPPKTKSRS